MPMTPDAKRALSKAIRALRERLLTDLHAATESRYRLSLSRADRAGLAETPLHLRLRLEAWIEARVRALPPTERDAARDRARREIEHDAAATWVNRLVYLRLLEGFGLRDEPVVAGGWDSEGYRRFRDLAPALVDGDDTRGYATLLELVFEDLAVDLPGLYGEVGLTRLVPMPPATLRAVVEALNDPALTSCWDDDMTLGWVYQYWNDPAREAIDAKLNGGGKVEPHEIASKTQMFTERYMVEWLLHNSLGQIWRAYWTPLAFRPGPDGTSVIDRLEARRAEWRSLREAGEVAPDALMPIHGDQEHLWRYWVDQPLPEDLRAALPEHPMDLRILDPACGSGHFLVVAFDLLWQIYVERAQERGEPFVPEAACRAILEENLHGVDLDPRAVQIAAAALLLKAWTRCPEYRPGRLNLVATRFNLADLPPDDASRVALRQALRDEAGLPEAFTDDLVERLSGVDHLGTLLRVDKEVDAALAAFERRQGDLFDDRPSAHPARSVVLDKLEAFLAQHTTGADLGLRLYGEQLAAGVRFVRMVREGRYHLVVANPPYQGTAKLADAAYVKKRYPKGKADLFAAFLERGLQLCARGGMSAMLTMRNWMFIKQYEKLRTWLIDEHDLRSLGDFAIGAFDEVPNDVLSVVASVFRKQAPAALSAVAHLPTPPDDKSYDRNRTARKRAAVLCGVGRHAFDTRRFAVIEGEPLVYWWSPDFLDRYARTPKLGDEAEGRKGLITSDDGRFLRKPWEVTKSPGNWVPYIKGAAGKEWFEPVDFTLEWSLDGIQVRVRNEGAPGGRILNEDFYFVPGIAFSMIGNSFSARLHRSPSVFGNKGSSVFPADRSSAVCAMNSSTARWVLQSLNPGIGFEIGDVNRLPLFPVESADAIYARLDQAFTEHEAHREPSVEFEQPGPSCWEYAQAWAQRAVDRPEGAPLPAWEPVYVDEPATDHVSFAVGVALGRFEGEQALPHGILYLSSADEQDGLAHPAARPLREAWATYGGAIAPGKDLRTWLRTRFFSDVHLGMYEKRPIHWPLSSEKLSFVAWVNIHRMTADSLRILLAEHLLPEQSRLEGRLADVHAARGSSDKAAAREADARWSELKALSQELAAFIADVRQCAEAGPPPTDPKCPARAADARYAPDLDDGVMINSAALWPLLLPQWKDPKKWWKELCLAKGRKDYDWSHLSARYFPDRVDAKCKDDPSLAVAHGCFWRYHPARALAWELRLQDEIGPDFQIEEPGRQGHYDTFLANQPGQVQDILDKEHKRRRRKHGDTATAPQLGLALE